MINKRSGFVWSELLIASAIFAVGILVGAYCFNFSTEPVPPSQKNKLSPEAKAKPNEAQPSAEESPVEVMGFQGIPSGVEIIKALSDQRQKKRPASPYDPQIRAIMQSSTPPSQKINSLFVLANALPPEGKGKAYASIVSITKGRDFQDLVVPKIWDPQISPDLAYTLATSLLLQPDSVKLPYALQFLQHPNEDIGFLGYSLLWSYFPNEPDTNYAKAVQRFLANPRAPR